ncbi:MAG: carbamoyltransferase HypF [Clostridiaceae bacterium]
MIRFGVSISGIVQGVGFRPFLYREAARHRLNGFVRNTSFGVYAEVEGTAPDCEAFFAALETNAPPLSRIASIRREEIPVLGDTGFHILGSEGGGRTALISPDIGICDACRRELFDPANRRCRYPFINCTDCGPRFTIIQDSPYDRKNTSMAPFTQCAPCQREYDDPLDRRFHAQPNACPDCGPKLRFLVEGVEQSGDPIALFTSMIRRGGVVAVKGLGGFHLACDAQNERAVALLRARKQRYEKPFAVMARDLEAARTLCCVSLEEEALLTSHQKPIVLLRKKPEFTLAPSVAPGNNRLGVMLPYTPLHCLLMEHFPVLVMTSGNPSDRPMVYRDEDAAGAFSSLADAVLTHNRPIIRRMDDSVCVVSRGEPRFLRRARGWAPEPLPLNGNVRTILAVGAQQKNTFCLLKGENAFLSGHIGDLDDPDTESSAIREIGSFERLFDAEPECVAYDAHPDYSSTKIAQSLGIPAIAVQHHRAHFASVLAEHGKADPAIGFVWDGTGYGDDGTIWGGETLFGTLSASRRIGHLLPFRLLGGEAAVREPWRTALSVCTLALGRERALALFPERVREASLLLSAADAGLNAIETTSMGRLFDAIAALAGIRQVAAYEGQAAIELEQAADLAETGAYRFDILPENGKWVYDWRPVITTVAEDVAAGVSIGRVSMRFHRALSALLAEAAEETRQVTGCGNVALSGGCFQNELLLELCADALEARGFTVLYNRLVPCNDGGISYGQAAIAAALQKEGVLLCASPFPGR